MYRAAAGPRVHGGDDGVGAGCRRFIEDLQPAPRLVVDEPVAVVEPEPAAPSVLQLAPGTDVLPREGGIDLQGLQDRSHVVAGDAERRADAGAVHGDRAGPM